MNIELQEKLFESFPKLFIQRHLSMRETCMCWGVETGDGWFEILWDLCEKLKNIKGIEFTQVKEKYGSLRVYYEIKATVCMFKFKKLKSKEKRKINRLHKTVDYFIYYAEMLSIKTCEYCGSKKEKHKIIYKGKPRNIFVCKKCKKEDWVNHY